MIINIILGRAGSGKGTLSHRYISKHPNVRWIESGELIRRNLASNAEIQALINNGNLIPSETICDIVISEIVKSDTNVILDGYPRRLDQLIMLKEKLPEATINAILIDCSPDVCMERLLHRVADRNDDYPDAIMQRFKLFNDNINEIVDALGTSLKTINGNDDKDLVYHKFENMIM